MTEGEDSTVSKFRTALEGASPDDLRIAFNNAARIADRYASDPENLNQLVLQDGVDENGVPFEYFIKPNQENAAAATASMDYFADRLAALGFDTNGDPLPAGGSAQDVAAGNLSARFSELNERRRASKEDERLRQEAAEENIRQFDESRELEEERQAEAQRETNIKGSLDLLESGVRRGELLRNEAHDRMVAASDSANVQAKTVTEFGGRNLAPGATHFPNLGPDGPAANAAAAFGLPFTPFETGGTFALNPAANAAPIAQAVAGSAGSDLANQAAQNAAAALAGLGLPGVGG